MYLQFLIQDSAFKRWKSREEGFAGGENQMGECYSVAIGSTAEDSIANIAVPDLFSFDLRNIERFSTIWANQSQVDRWRCLEFYFEELMTHIRELPVVLVRGVPKGTTDQTVKCRPAVPFLIATGIAERASDEPSHSIE